MSNDIPIDLMRDYLDYDPSTGLFIWKRSFSGRGVRIGSIAGTTHQDGHVQIRFARKSYAAHRVAYAWVHGWCPDVVDHKNLINDDNRINNLRPATGTANNANCRVRSHNKSGLKGAYQQANGAWYATIRANGKARRLGTFATAEEAHAAYVQAAAEIFGEFARAA